jgi:hypothetical protein
VSNNIPPVPRVCIILCGLGVMITGIGGTIIYSRTDIGFGYPITVTDIVLGFLVIVLAL